MTPTLTVTDAKLLPCRRCGADCRLEDFCRVGTSLFMCANSIMFGGTCSELVYLTESAWNTRTPASPTSDDVERKLANLFDRIEVQANCLESYAEMHGFNPKPVQSAFHSQAMHFRDLVAEGRSIAALAAQPPKVENGECDLCAGKCRGHSLGHPEEWVPEPGSRDAIAQNTPGANNATGK